MVSCLADKWDGEVILLQPTRRFAKHSNSRKKNQVKQPSISVLFLIMLFIAAFEPASLKGQTSSISDLARSITNSGPIGLTDDYIIGIEDVLQIYVWKEPDFSVKELVVRSDGKISIPLVSDIQAGGLTPLQLQENLTEKLRQFVASPNVTVTVLKSLSRSVSIVGQVSKPGTYPMNAPITVIELIARAGGITESAKAKNIRVIRKENGKTAQFVFNYKDAIKGTNLRQNILLKIGDVVLVP
jgi:polysaccharide biosynthesis/export protein